MCIYVSEYHKVKIVFPLRAFIFPQGHLPEGHNGFKIVLSLNEDKNEAWSAMSMNMCGQTCRNIQDLFPMPLLSKSIKMAAR